jgi:transcription initiation factor TFIID subunit 15
MTEVSSTRLYLGNLPRNATKAEVEGHFQTHGTGEITEIKLMNGFGFIEYKDAMDARDVVPAFRKCSSLPLRVLLPRLTLSRWLRLHGRASHCPVRPRFAPQ